VKIRVTFLKQNGPVLIQVMRLKLGAQSAMKKIKLTQNKYALVDDADFYLLSGVKWYAMKYPSGDTYYAVRARKANGKSISRLQMQNVIMNPAMGMLVDHKDGDGLNNQRSNLRICTPKENGYNRKINKNNKSGFKGVRNNKNRWEVKIIKDGKYYHLGRFKDLLEAAKVYNDAAKKLFGEFAKLNKIK
jgi:hypothetical protein